MSTHIIHTHSKVHYEHFDTNFIKIRPLFRSQDNTKIKIKFYFQIVIVMFRRFLYYGLKLYTCPNFQTKKKKKEEIGYLG